MLLTITVLLILLARAGHLEEAENLIKTMEQPDVVTWIALLGACRWNNDIERAERCSRECTQIRSSRCINLCIIIKYLFSC